MRTPRRTAPERRAETIHVKVSRLEKQAIVASAQRHGLSTGPWLRSLALDDIAAEGIEAPSENTRRVRRARG